MSEMVQPGKVEGSADLAPISLHGLSVISLHQPWASLTFVPDCKTDETRGRSAPGRLIGRRFGLHAALKTVVPSRLPRALHLLCVELFGWDYPSTLPRGSLLGTHRLAQSVMIANALRDSGGGRNLICGDWEPGRHAWALRDGKLLPEPIPMKGHQSWWRLPDRPDISLFDPQPPQNPDGGSER